MDWQQPLVRGVLERRYKRFLADVALGGDTVTVHCPNTGAMLGCSEPGSAVWLSTSDNLKRRYPHTLEIVQGASGHLIGVNPGRANTLVAEAISDGRIEALAGYGDCRREVAVPDEPGRFDFRLEAPGRPACYVEVKSVTLMVDDDGLGAFPDAVSERAARHVRALVRRLHAGERAMLVYCVQHTGVRRVMPAVDIDPAYARTVADAAGEGLEVIAIGCDVGPAGIAVTRPLPVIV